MYIPQKCQYALRALFELARHYDEGPVKIAEIAKAQSIPPRFLEIILGQLKHGAFVDSQRGNGGGYYLLRDPEGLSVGEVIRFMQGSLGPVLCVAGKEEEKRCPLRGSCVFLSMWKEVKDVVSQVYDSTTFAKLVERDRRMRQEYVANYTI
ncbi:MAG: Rrf2 family transcriptional regulator [Candidatus Hydrogenedentes bacterium]|nr:Rrf2 family transcriptional regulator [Candidatus Hydrogenedentota bacterium]